MAADNGLGILYTGTPAALSIDLATRSDEAGFRSGWFPEITFADAFGPAVVAGQRTSRLALGTGVVGIWSRSPATLALQAATAHQLCGERLIVGLGVQARGYVEGWHNQRYRKPVTAMREFVTILRSLLSGERTNVEGEIFSVRNFQLTMEPPSRPVRIYVAANGPRMIQAAAELGDGMIGYFHSLEYVRDVVMPNVHAGLERAGRSRDDFDVAVGFPSLVTPDESGIQGIKGQVMMFATALDSAPAYHDSIAAAGFAEVAREIQGRVAGGDLRGAVELVPDEMADALTLAGSAGHVRERIEAYRAAGLTQVLVNPSAPDVWFPLYEGHFPVESLATLPPFDFPRFLRVFDDTIEGLAA